MTKLKLLNYINGGFHAGARFQATVSRVVDIPRNRDRGHAGSFCHFVSFGPFLTTLDAAFSPIEAHCPGSVIQVYLS
jgi:hypothetical protein